MRSVVAVVLLVGCGGGSSSKNTVPNELLDPGGHVVDPNDSTPPVKEPSDDTPEPTLAAITPEKACERLQLLRGEGCSWANRFPADIEREDVCLRSMNQWFAPETEGHQTLHKTASCWALDCEGAESCMVRIQSQKAPPPPRKCGEDGVGNVIVDKGEFAKRNGVNVTRFSDAKTSEQQPIEVCGIDGEVEWMTRATCNGGKHPFENAMAANARRDSYMKTGGRCNSILDRYTVDCPEATYTVFVDRYICPAP